MIDLPRFSSPSPPGTSPSDRALRVSQNVSKDGRDDADSHLQSQSLARAEEHLSSKNEMGRKAVQETQKIEQTRVDRRKDRLESLEVRNADNSNSTSALNSDRAVENKRLEKVSRERQETYIADRERTDDGRSTSEVGSNRYERQEFVQNLQDRAAGENASAAAELVREQQAESAKTQIALRGSKVQSVGEYIVERQVQSRGETLSLSDDQAGNRQQGLDRLKEAFKGGAEDIVGANVSVKA